MDSVHLSTRSWRFRVKHLADSLLHVLLPPVCASCGKAGELLCVDCLKNFPRLHEPLCQRCGRPVSESQPVCPSCRLWSPSLTQLRAAVPYTGPVPDIVHKLKYDGLFALAKPLAELMAESWPNWQAPVDLMLPVPLHPKRKKKRGYNQAELLTRHLHGVLGVSRDPQALRRVRDTRPQVDLSREDRLTNVVGAFAAVRERVEGRNILLVDDVCTTGSTISEAANALLGAGAETVSGYCLARSV